jgi:hypothetical protein
MPGHSPEWPLSEEQELRQNHVNGRGFIHSGSSDAEERSADVRDLTAHQRVEYLLAPHGATPYAGAREEEDPDKGPLAVGTIDPPVAHDAPCRIEDAVVEAADVRDLYQSGACRSAGEEPSRQIGARAADFSISNRGGDGLPHGFPDAREHAPIHGHVRAWHNPPLSNRSGLYRAAPPPG